MIELAPLVDLFFDDLPWDRRLEAIANCGYRWIETWKGGDAAELKSMQQAGDACGVGLVSIVMNFANEAPVAPIGMENRERFIERIDRYSDYALAAGCRQGIVTTGQIIGGRGYAAQRRALVDALRAAGERVAAKGFRLNLEPLNTEVDHPGYFLDCPREAVAIVREVGLPNVNLLYDLYHMTIMTGNQTQFLEQNIDRIGHFHVAGVPGRHEPMNGELDYPFVLKKIEAAGFDGCIGLEYMPRLTCPETLVETRVYLLGK